MNVLLLGGNGILGPPVAEHIATRHRLRITDIVPIEGSRESRRVDVSDLDQVLAAAEGMDAIVNCSVQRRDRRGAFEVNTLGTLNALRAAVAHGIDRFINTGPRFSLVGRTYLDFDHTIPESIPPHPGIGLYPITKSLGLEAARVFSEHASLYILTLLFSSFRDPDPSRGRVAPTLNPMLISFRDAARAVECALEVNLESLPSRFECFYINADLPHNRFPNTRARRILAWEPQDAFDHWWCKTD